MNLTESEIFEPEIYQLEITDDAIGGENGVLNLPHKQLANRTKWLKAAIDAIVGASFVAAKALKLQTPRKINGVDFDGSADIEVLATATSAATANTSFFDTDIFGFFGTASNSWRKITGANFKNTLKTYFDNLYQPIGALLFSDMPAGSVIQKVSYITGTMATGTVVLPADNSIPQNTEGTQFMALTFTPKKANSKLFVDVCAFYNSSAQAAGIVSLFRDSEANAIATGWVYIPNVNYPVSQSFQKEINANSILPTTFKVRIGCNSASTITFNGSAGSPLFGGTLASSITITEIAQ